MQCLSTRDPILAMPMGECHINYFNNYVQAFYSPIFEYFLISLIASNKNSTKIARRIKKYIPACCCRPCRNLDLKRLFHLFGLATGRTKSKTTAISAYRKPAISVHWRLILIFFEDVGYELEFSRLLCVIYMQCTVSMFNTDVACAIYKSMKPDKHSECADESLILRKITTAEVATRSKGQTSKRLSLIRQA